MSMQIPVRPVSLLQLAAVIGERLLALVTSRFVVVVSTTCAVMYGGLWVAALLQHNGVVGRWLPVPVADSVILSRSGAELRPGEPDAAQLDARRQALAGSQVAPGAAGGDSSLTLEVQTAPPVDLWITDDSGGEIGTNPETGLVRLQIPEASYSGRGTDPQLVSIPHAAGRYHIELLGTTTGTFQVLVRLFANDDVDHAVQYAGKGEVFEDTLLQSDVGVGTNADDGSPKLDVSPAQVLVAGKVPEQQVAGVSVTAEASPEPSTPASSPQPAPTPLPAPLVVRPRPLPKPPIPLPPVPVLPASLLQAVTAQSSGNPDAAGPAGAYGGPTPSQGQQVSDASQPLQEIIRAPEAAVDAIRR